MKVSGKNSKSGEEFSQEASTINDTFIESMDVFDMTEEKARKIIEGLDISADAKSLLLTFSKATIRVGSQIIKIGRKIVEFVSQLFLDYPSASFGMIFGAIAGFLVASIPILGVVLGPIFTHLDILLVLVSGLSQDFKDKALARRIAEINAKFNPLKG
jgi:hypothetical protein